MMKTFFVVAFLFTSHVCFADEGRLKMVEAPFTDNEAENLVESLTDSFNSKDSAGFASLFTKSKAAKVRSVMKPILASHDIKMRVLEVRTISGDKDKMEFLFVYSWENNSEKRIVTSDVVAKMEGGRWKVESEKTKDVKNTSKVERVEPALNFGGGGQVVMNPGNDFLPGDIARSNRPDCSNGKCNVR
jgi:hypothetical protein